MEKIFVFLIIYFISFCIMRVLLELTVKTLNKK